MSPASIVIDKSPFLTPDTTNYHIMGLMDFSHGGLGLNQTGRGGLQAVSGDGDASWGQAHQTRADVAETAMATTSSRLVVRESESPSRASSLLS